MNVHSIKFTFLDYFFYINILLRRQCGACYNVDYLSHNCSSV